MTNKRNQDNNILLMMYRNELIVKVSLGFFSKRSSIVFEPCIEVEVNIGGFDEHGRYHESSPKTLRRKIRFSSDDEEKLEETLNSIIEIVREKEFSLREKFSTLKKMTYKTGSKLYSNGFKLLRVSTENLTMKKLTCSKTVKENEHHNSVIEVED